jgi:hypothetical protein
MENADLLQLVRPGIPHRTISNAGLLGGKNHPDSGDINVVYLDRISLKRTHRPIEFEDIA